MKKIMAILILCLVLTGTMVVPVSAGSVGAIKADLFQGDSDVAIDPPVIGFAVFNTNGNNGINVQIVVKDLDPGTYTLAVQAPVPGYPPEFLGQIVIDENRHGNAHVQISDLVFAPGDTILNSRVNIRDDGTYVARTNVVPVPLKQ